MKPSVGKITGKFGFKMFSFTTWLLRRVYNITELVIQRKELEEIVDSTVEVGNWFWDRVFYYTDEGAWKRIIQSDITDRIRWLSNRRDCDNIAAIFKSHVSEYFGLNGVGIAIGEVKDAETNNHIGYHAWDIPIDEKGIKFYDPQWEREIGLKALTKADEGAVIGSWSYYPDFILWY